MFNLHNIKIKGYNFLIGKLRLTIITEALTEVFKFGIIQVTYIQINID